MMKFVLSFLGGYVRRVARGKEIKTSAQGILILIPSFVIMAFATTATWIYVSLVLFSFGKWFCFCLCYLFIKQCHVINNPEGKFLKTL